MKNSVTLSIPTPCSEKWDNFAPTQNGGFCKSCSQVVTDFTKMNDDEIIHYLNSRSAHSCGRFRSDQLKTYSHQSPLKINIGFFLLKAGLIGLILFLFNKQASAQVNNTNVKTEVVQQQPQDREETSADKLEHKIKGVVISDEDNAPLPGVNIYLKGSNDGTSTDEKGEFQFPKTLKEGDVLVFSYIGFEPKEYVVPKNAQTKLEINMSMAYVTMLGAVTVVEHYQPEPTGIKKLWQKVKNIF